MGIYIIIVFVSTMILSPYETLIIFDIYFSFMKSLQWFCITFTYNKKPFEKAKIQFSSMLPLYVSYIFSVFVNWITTSAVQKYNKTLIQSSCTYSYVVGIYVTKSKAACEIPFFSAGRPILLDFGP